MSVNLSHAPANTSAMIPAPVSQSGMTSFFRLSKALMKLNSRSVALSAITAVFPPPG